MSNKKVLTILNLYKGPLIGLEELFGQNERVHILTALGIEQVDIDIVILPDSENCEFVKKEYSSIAQSTKFFKFGQIKKIKEFILQGGRHIHSKEEMNSAAKIVFNKHVLDNEISMHYQDYFDGEFHSFSIVNHLMMGTVVDEMSSYVFDNELDLVGVRSYFDQVVYYIMYLKQAGFAGIPIECQYGIFEGQFILRMQAMVEGFSIDNILNSFHDNNENGQVYYLLSAAAHSCHYMDISLLDTPSKISFTGIFDGDIKSKSWGLSFNQIPYSSAVSKSLPGNSYQDIQKRMERLGGIQDKLENNLISGGFENFSFELADDSVLKKAPKKEERLVDYMLDLFQQTYPEYELNQFTHEIFEELVSDFPDKELCDSLAENDIDFIVEQIQKNHLVEALDEARNNFRDDEEKRNKLQDSMGNEVSKLMSEYIDDDMINDVLSLEDPLKPSGERETIFGIFEPSIRKFNTKDAFNKMSAGFMDPTGLDLSGAFDDLDLSEMETQSNTIDPWIEPEEEDLSFGTEDFENILHSSLPAFAENASDEMIKLSNNSLADDFETKIKSLKDNDEDDFIQAFSNGFDERINDENMRVGNWEEENFDLMQIVRSTMNSSEKLSSLEQSVKNFIEKEAPWKLQKGLEDFSKDNGFEFSSLSSEELSKFGQEKLPSIMAELLVDKKSINEYKNDLEEYVEKSKKCDIDHVGPSRFQRKFKERLEKKLKVEISLEKIGDTFKIPKGELDSEVRTKVVNETMKDVFAEEFGFEEASKYEIEHKELRLIKELSKTLSMDEKLVRKIVKGASKVAKDLELEFVNENFIENEKWNFESENIENEDAVKSVKALEHKIKTIENENNNLKTSLTEMQLKLATTNDTRDQFDKLLNDPSFSEDDFFAEDQKKQLIESLNSGGKIEDSDILKIDKSLERESELRENMHTISVELKKEQIESEKKEIAFKYELNKYIKMIKNKELVLNKVKESIKVAMDKKEKQMNTLKEEVDQLTKQVQSLGGAPGLVRRDDKEHILNEEIKNLKKSKDVLEKRIENEIDAHEDTEEKYHEVKSAADSAKKKLLTLETELNSVQGQLKLLKEQNTNLVQGVESSKGVLGEKLQKENEQLKEKLTLLENQSLASINGPSEEDILNIHEKNKQLNVKVKELVSKLKKAEKASVINSGKDSGGTAREKHLEKSMLKITNEVTKLRSEYAEKKKEALKYKTDNVGMTNKMTVMQQDLDRLNKQLTSARNKNKAA